MIRDDIEQAVRKALGDMGAADAAFTIEPPPASAGADYATNAALSAGKKLGRAPREVALELCKKLSGMPDVDRVEAAGPGFVNFFLARDTFAQTIRQAQEAGGAWGSNDSLSGTTVMVEYTDPNPFKEFHIGHLMSNAVGESVARLLAHSGADVIRANYQGDVGPHVAKALWALLKKNATEPTVEDIGRAYAEGAKAYEEDEQAKEEIDAINQKVYARSDERLNRLYDWGRKISLEHFEELYRVLGTRFDEYFFESETGARGADVVRAHPELFEKSDGAMIFRGETRGLHTRVFLNRFGLPTYEAKDLGLAELKRERRAFDRSITVTANEQNEYFRVVLAALYEVHPEWKGVFEHVSHGLMVLQSGKMSSRKGNVVTGESLVSGMIGAAAERMKERPPKEKDAVARQVAIAAIKYAILRQGSGKNIVFDEERSLSLEGDSGPYIQYAHTRCVSILRKAREEGAAADTVHPTQGASEPERLIVRFPEAVSRAAREYEPHYVAQYLLELSGAFNSWYASERVLGTPEAAYKLAVVDAVRQTLERGLWLLGIEAPEEM